MKEHWEKYQQSKSKVSWKKIVNRLDCDGIVYSTGDLLGIVW